MLVTRKQGSSKAQHSHKRQASALTSPQTALQITWPLSDRRGASTGAEPSSIHNQNGIFTTPGPMFHWSRLLLGGGVGGPRLSLVVGCRCGVVGCRPFRRMCVCVCVFIKLAAKRQRCAGHARCGAFNSPLAAHARTSARSSSLSNAPFADIGADLNSEQRALRSHFAPHGDDN